MTGIALFLILASALLHATWHFICKQQKPYVAFYLVLSFSALLATSPLAVWSGVHVTELPVQCWISLTVAGVSGCLTNASLATAYRSANLSLIYPLARALPILMTAILTEILYFGFDSGKPLSTAAILAQVIIFIGCAFIPMTKFSDFKHIHHHGGENSVYGWLLLAALGTTLYTVADKYGIDYLLNCGSPRNKILGSCAYACMRECFLFVTMIVFILCIPAEREHLTMAIFKTPAPYIAGIIATTAYIMVLGAMHFVDNVSYVQAFRQVSLPIGVLLGVFILKEKMPLPRLIGIVILVAGLVMLAFS